MRLELTPEPESSHRRLAHRITRITNRRFTAETQSTQRLRREDLKFEIANLKLQTTLCAPSAPLCVSAVRLLSLCAILLTPCAAAHYTSAQTATRDAVNMSTAASNVVRGRVADANGASIANASVVLRNLATGLERVAQTDADGAFAFAGVRAGDRYRLTASAQGFARASSELTTRDDDILLSLEPAPLVEQVFVVSGSRQEELRESLNTKVDVVTRAQIRDTGYESVGEVLREVPGVLTRRGSETAGEAGASVQGIDSRQVLVLLDGQPLIGARGIKRGVINLDRQSIGRLERIEVVKGASSALYGSDAIGGVINLITREPSHPFEFALTTSGGTRGIFDGRAEAGFARKSLSGFFTLERHKNNGFDLTPTTFDTTGAGFHRTDAYARVRYQFADNFSVTGFANSYWNNARGRSVGEEGAQFNDINDEAQNYGLTADWQLDPRTSLQARGYFARFDEISRGQLAPPRNTILPDGNLFERLGKLDATFTRVIGERQLLQAGGEWWTNRYRGTNRVRDAAQGHRADTRVLWAQDRISLNRFTVTLGARYDNHSIFGSAFSPKAAVNMRLTETLSARASYGRGFRAPDLGQLYFRFLNPTNFYQVIGNPDLEPERANSYQAGGEYTARRGRLRFGFNAFRNDVENLIEAVNLGFIRTQAQLNSIIAQEGIDPLFNPQLNRLLFLYKNIRNVHTQGFEFDGNVALPRGFNAGGAYTYLDARDETANLFLANRHRHQGFTRFGWEDARRGFRTNVRGTFYSSWIATRTTVSGARLDTIAPAFALWDFYAAQRFFRNERSAAEIFFTVDNITNNQDPNTGRLNAQGAPLPLYRAEAGRTFRIGVRYTFGGAGVR